MDWEGYNTLDINGVPHKPVISPGFSSKYYVFWADDVLIEQKMEWRLKPEWAVRGLELQFVRDGKAVVKLATGGRGFVFPRAVARGYISRDGAEVAFSNATVDSNAQQITGEAQYDWYFWLSPATDVCDYGPGGTKPPETAEDLYRSIQLKVDELKAEFKRYQAMVKPPPVEPEIQKAQKALAAVYMVKFVVYMANQGQTSEYPEIEIYAEPVKTGKMTKDE